MRILILSNLCPPFYIGGYEVACANVAAGLHARGHDVRLATSYSHILGTDPPYVERCLGLHWFQPVPIADEKGYQYALFQASVSDYTNTAVVLRLLRDFSPDVVYVWNLFGVGGIAILDLLNTLHVPWVMHLMDNMPHHLLAGAPSHVRSVFGGSAIDLFSRGRIIAMSEKLVEEVLTQTGIAFDGGVEIVPGWVDVSGLPEPSETLRGDTTRFVCTGQIIEHKGIDLILEAAALLRGQNVGRFTIDVFGRGDIAFYIDMAQRLGVQDIVFFRGSRPQHELLSLYPGFQAFLFPTWEREPFGFTPIEAAACGCVPILTRQCGAAERLVDTAHCLKIDRTIEDLVGAMRQIVTGSVDVAAMSRRATAAVRSDLSLERALTRIEGVLAEDARVWNRRRGEDPRLQLLLHTKHQLAAAMMFGR
jgi:glycogen(starch) synthase